MVWWDSNWNNGNYDNPDKLLNLIDNRYNEDSRIRQIEAQQWN